MCGICGVISLDGPLDHGVAAAIKPMTDALRHRGPDGDGFFRDSFAALGHRRLAIIDRAGGGQPMTNEDESLWIVFNGEIYNHRALRQQLVASGHRYRTMSDTETILHAYEEYGTACVQRVEGMFSFAIYDQSRREVFIARDRLGKKPLFYAVVGDVLLFASEMKSFFSSPLWDGELNLSSLETYFTLGYFVAPDTVYRSVKKLMPGHWLHASRAGLDIKEYWDVSEFDADDRDEQTVLADLEELLGEAVHARLESEVPLGAFLSGGIDSGLVVSFMSGEGQAAPVVTTTVGFGERSHNELEAAGITAAHLKTSHFPHVIVPKLDEALDKIVSAFDEPFADASAIPTYYVSRIARQHVTVALTGDGGDETFSGYDFRYVPHVLESRARKWAPGPLGRTLFQAIGSVWPRSPHLPRPLRLSNVLENLSGDPAAAYFSDLCFVKPTSARRLLGKPASAPLSQSPAYEQVTGAYQRCGSADPLQRAQYADLKIYLPNGPLVKVDRMSMLNSLEVRSPLLDRRVVEFAFRLPAGRKMPRLRGKHLLRALAKRRLPARISELPKRGFDAPVGSWITGPYATLFNEEVLARDSAVSTLLDVGVIKEHLARQRRGDGDHSQLLWAVWMFEHWARLRRSIEVSVPQ